MPSASVASENSIASPTRHVVRGVAWLVGTAIAVRLAEMVVGRSPLGAALAGAVIVDLAMTRAGVRWDEHEGLSPNRSWSFVSKRIGIGVAAASVLVVLPLVVSLIVGAATISAGTPSTSLIFGLLRGVAVGVRDELLYRGLPLLVAARAGVRESWGVGYAALVGAAPLVLAEGSSWEAVAVAVGQGALFAMLWVRTNTAWTPVAAHAAWVMLAGVGLRGGFVEVSWASGMLADGARTRGLPAIICVITSILLVVIVAKKIVGSSESAHERVVS